MKVIPIMSTKGGVGKSRICAGLGRALRDRNLRVGFLDVDWVAPNLHIELGINKDPTLLLQGGVGDIINPIISPEGFPLISSAFIFPPDQAISMDEESKVHDIMEITSPGVVDWGDLDYLLMDTPPTTARFIHAALLIEDLYGVVLVAQPASSSLADLLRTVSLLRDLQVPLLGLIGNQVYVTCSHGERLNLYDLGEGDLKAFSKSMGLTYLGSVPHVVPGVEAPILSGSMSVLVDMLLSQKPEKLKVDSVSNIPYRLLLTLARRKSLAGKN